MKSPEQWTREELHTHLQQAIDLEFWTIPLYLSALYSIEGLDELVKRLRLQLLVIDEVDHDQILGARLLRVALLQVQISSENSQASPGSPLWLHRQSLVDRLAGWCELVEVVEGAAAIQKTIGDPCRIVFHFEHVIDGWQSRLSHFGFEQ